MVARSTMSSELSRLVKMHVTSSAGSTLTRRCINDRATTTTTTLSPKEAKKSSRRYDKGARSNLDRPIVENTIDDESARGDSLRQKSMPILHEPPLAKDDPSLLHPRRQSLSRECSLRDSQIVYQDDNALDNSDVFAGTSKTPPPQTYVPTMIDQKVVHKIAKHKLQLDNMDMAEVLRVEERFDVAKKRRYHAIDTQQQEQLQEQKQSPEEQSRIDYDYIEGSQPRPKYRSVDKQRRKTSLENL